MKIITLNLHCFAEENHIEKLNRIAAFIKEKDIDICFFQEVAQDQNLPFVDEHLRKGNAALHILNLLKGYNLSYRAIKTGYGHFDEGLAIITKYRIRDSHLTYISKTTDYSNWICRGVLVTDIDYYGETIRLFTTHLGWDMMGEKFVKQFKNMKRIIKSSPYFSIIAGDFNHPHGSKEYRMICNTKMYSVSDIFGANPLDFPTFHNAIDANTFEESTSKVASQNRMIDYIFTTEKVHVDDFSIFFNKEKDYVSDHSLVYTKINMAGDPNE